MEQVDEALGTGSSLPRRPAGAGLQRLVALPSAEWWWWGGAERGGIKNWGATAFLRPQEQMHKSPGPYPIP